MKNSMSGKCPKVSIVIRAYNEGQHISRLLTGIEQQSLKDVEVVVVDSRSTDETVQIAVSHGAKIVCIHPDEFTFGRLLNYGVAATSGEFVVIVSAHCYPVFPDWLEQIIKPFGDPKMAVSYGKQRGGETNWYSEHQFFTKYFPDISQPQQGRPYSHNANAAIRRSLWEKHPYNENITGLEDLAWSSWAFEQGYRIAYLAEAEVVHLHDEIPIQVHNRYRREAVAMKHILPHSQFTLWHFLRLWWKATLSDLWQARYERVVRQHWWSIFWFRWMQYWGTFRGYNFAGEVDAHLHQAFYYPPGILDEKIPAPRSVQPIDYNTNEG